MLFSPLIPGGARELTEKGEEGLSCRTHKAEDSRRVSEPTCMVGEGGGCWTLRLKSVNLMQSASGQPHAL